MNDTIDLRVRLVIREGTNQYRQDIKITDLSDAAKKLLHRIDARILEPDFYRQSMEARTIPVSARTMLEKSGNIGNPEQPHPSSILLPELTSRDRRFEVCAYGHPRHTETFVKWLDGCARVIEPHMENRESKRASAHMRVDALINERLDDLVRSEPLGFLKPKGESWVVDWSKLWLARSTRENQVLLERLKNRVEDAGCVNMRQYLRDHFPGGQEFVEKADEAMAPSAPMSMAM